MADDVKTKAAETDDKAARKAKRKEKMAAKRAEKKAEMKAKREARRARRQTREEKNFRLRGFHTGTELRRSLPMMVRKAEEAGKEVSIGTTRKTPQMRLRPIALCDAAEASGVPEEDRVSTQRFLDGFNQYRALILVLDAKILVRSGESRALIDRHPKCGHEVVDAYLAGRAPVPLPSVSAAAPTSVPSSPVVKLNASSAKSHEIVV